MESATILTPPQLNIGLKTLHQGIPEPALCGDLVYKFKIYLSSQFRRLSPF